MSENERSCDCVFRLTDRDLPPIARTQANLWKAEYFKALRELTKANKGLRRLRQGIKNSKLRWTLERPTKPGMWLVEYPDNTRRMLRIVMRDGELRAYPTNLTRGWWTLHSQVFDRCKWAGPISEPLPLLPVGSDEEPPKPLEET